MNPPLLISFSEALQDQDAWYRALAENALLAKGVSLCDEIARLGGEALIVGGVVRDLLSGQPISDVDIATNVDIETVSIQFDVHDIGRSREFGITAIRYQEEIFEVANYRSESGHSDRRRPDSVAREGSFAADSARRDLTINALGLSKDGVIVDYHGGIAHLREKVIHTVGDPGERFGEDALRLLRAARFSAQMDFALSSPTKEAMLNLASLVDTLAPERIRDELMKAAKLGGQKLARYVEQLDEVGLLKRILPELTALQGLDHNPEHHPEGGVWEHVLAALRTSVSPNPIHNLAILFHDLGKAVTRTHDEDGTVHYYGHEAAGVPIFNGLADRLKFSNAERAEIVHSVAHHMNWHNMDKLGDKKVLQIRQSPHWETFYQVVLADARSRMFLWDPIEFEAHLTKADELYHRYGDREMLERKLAALVDGQKIMDLTGAQGADIGRIKNAVRDTIIQREFNISPEEIQELILSLV